MSTTKYSIRCRSAACLFAVALALCIFVESIDARVIGQQPIVERRPIDEPAKLPSQFNEFPKRVPNAATKPDFAILYERLVQKRTAHAVRKHPLCYFNVLTCPGFKSDEMSIFY